MNKDPFFDFIVDKASNTIIVKRTFDADLDQVWAAWTTAELLDQWWAPEGYECHTKSMTFEKGGRRHYLMSGPEGALHWGITTYEEIEKSKRFSGLECFANEDAEITNDFPVSSYSVQFNREETQTLIHHQTVYDTFDQLESSLSYGFKEGTVGAYARLDQLLKDS